MDFDYDSEATSEAYRLLATLLMKEPEISHIENFRESFQVEFAASVNDIALDFSELFYNPLEHLLPYESAYLQLTDSPVVPDNVTDQVYAFYMKEGLLLDEGVNIVPDHISAELFFMSYLIETNKRDSLKEFLERHAIRWIPQFCDDLFESAGTDFYREVAAVTKDLVLNEYEELSD